MNSWDLNLETLVIDETCYWLLPKYKCNQGEGLWKGHTRDAQQQRVSSRQQTYECAWGRSPCYMTLTHHDHHTLAEARDGTQHRWVSRLKFPNESISPSGLGSRPTLPLLHGAATGRGGSDTQTQRSRHGRVWVVNEAEWRECEATILTVPTFSSSQSLKWSK